MLRPRPGCSACLLMAASLLPLLLLATPGHPASARILLYHHVSTTTPPATSITPERFEAHLDLLAAGGYQVVPLTRIVDALESGTELDSRWVAITFDDAYQSLLSEAAPRLAARGWPYTVFVGTADVDAGHRPFLDWEALRTLHRQGALIANHSRDHAHMAAPLPGESDAARRLRLTREVTAAQDRLEAELGEAPRLFAYPYGEFDAVASDVLRELGFVAFGQQSGPVGSTTNRLAIPRFPLATGFDGSEALLEKLRTETLPLAAPRIPATVLPAAAIPPVLTLELATADVGRGSLRCFLNGDPVSDVDWQDGRVVTVRIDKVLHVGRSRLTCTAPRPGMPGAYYWYTHVYLQPYPDGSWYDG